MKPAVWGKHVWYSIHFVALQYPINPSEQDKKLYFEFYKTLGKVLPCAVCRNHFKVIWNQYPLTTDRLASRSALFAWTVEVHNLVNEDLGKPRMNLAQAERLYMIQKQQEHDFVVSPNGACEPPLVFSDDFPSPTGVEMSVDLFEALISVALLFLILLNIKKNRFPFPRIFFK
jgi:hypothetical protein